LNRDQLKGKAMNIAGRVQEQAGKFIGSWEQQAKGLAKQISGRIQEGFGAIRQDAESIGRQ
jgi:uncharacterized protein YjbJ (UPF0337 family)